MRASIVVKLFSLTTLLCLFILTTIYLGQTIFFKQYYANRKVNDIQTNIQSFKENYLKSSGDVLTIQKLEQDFYRENNAWITTLDSFGNLNNVNDFCVEVKMDTAISNGEFSGKTMTTVRLPKYNSQRVMNPQVLFTRIACLWTD